MTIAARLRYAREIADVHQRDLDRLAHRTEGHTGLIEARPNSDVFAGTLLAYAEVLGISLDWLIAGKGPDPDPDQVKAAVDAARARGPLPRSITDKKKTKVRQARDRTRPALVPQEGPASSRRPGAKKRTPANARRTSARKAAA